MPLHKKNPMLNTKFFFPCPCKKFHVQQKSFMLKKIPHHHKKVFHTHTHENFHAHEIRPTHSNKVSTLIKNGLLNHACTSNSHDFTIHKIQVKIHPTIPQATYNKKLHESSTLSKFHNTKQFNNSKIPQNKENNMIRQGFLTKLYDVQNSHKSKQQNDNVPPSSSQQNMKSTNLPTKKMKWAHLKVLFGWVWSMGSRVLKEPLFLIPWKYKKRWPIGRCHENTKKEIKKEEKKRKKKEVWRWVSEMGLFQRWSRTQKSEKILRERDEIKFRSLKE